jgi:hypothetical protein
MTDDVLRIAMWSGPRSISTAMMRSWGNRPDTAVCDEPLYAHYLLATRIAHPGAAEVIAHHETDWRKVAAWLTEQVPARSDGVRPRIFYQKHMSHHLLPHIDRGWLDRLTHAFLIREPREMLTSLIRNLPRPRIEDTGLPQQIEIVEYARRRTGRTPPIVEAREMLESPRRLLGRLCEALGVEFREEMLHWPAGRRDTDGIWAPHWYAAVEKSTGFEPYRPKNEPVPDELRGLLAECERYYDRLYTDRLR